MTFFPLRNPDGVEVLFNNGEARAIRGKARIRIDMLTADHRTHFTVDVLRDNRKAVDALVNNVARYAPDRPRAEALGAKLLEALDEA